MQRPAPLLSWASAGTSTTAVQQSSRASKWLIVILLHVAWIKLTDSFLMVLIETPLSVVLLLGHRFAAPLNRLQNNFDAFNARMVRGFGSQRLPDKINHVSVST